MPLFGGHLFGSEFYASASDAEFRAGLRLWWVAWQQQPAGSLPDDDVALCRFADLGRDIKAWRAVKARALHGFLKCSDGRLYHPLLCREVLIAWDRRVRDRDRKAKYRAKYAGQERAGDADVPRDKTRTERGQGADVPVPETVPSVLTGQDRTKERKKDSEADASERSALANPPQPRDIRKALWDDGVPIIRQLMGQSDSQARRLLGKLLADAHDDCARVYAVLREAESLQPVDPAAFLAKSVQPRDGPRARPQSQLSKAIRDLGLAMPSDDTLTIEVPP